MTCGLNKEAPTMMICRETESKIPYERGGEMAQHKTYHVTPGTDGDWKVKEEKASKASSKHETKAEAVERAKDLAKNQVLGQVIIHKQDGTIQTEHTYGKDPYPPKG